jgi:hypothetical protein
MYSYVCTKLGAQSNFSESSTRPSYHPSLNVFFPGNGVGVGDMLVKIQGSPALFIKWTRTRNRFQKKLRATELLSQRLTVCIVVTAMNKRFNTDAVIASFIELRPVEL